MDGWFKSWSDKMTLRMLDEDPGLVRFLRKGRLAWFWRPWIWFDRLMLRLPGQPRLRLPRVWMVLPLLAVAGLITSIVVAGRTAEPSLDPCGPGAPQATVLVGSSVKLGGGLVIANRLPSSKSQDQQGVTLVVPRGGQYRITQINYGLGPPFVEDELIVGKSATVLTNSSSTPGSGYQMDLPIKSVDVCWIRPQRKGVAKRLR